ncbi:MAG: 30S ribosomal protein S16, partial [Alphaproteobacteria bacterium MarineAlpha9_Bin3]
MPLKIRLSRGGNKKRPHYRIVLADSRAPRDGRFIERLGTYNPLLSKDSDQRIVFNEERVKHWLKNGAKPSDRVTKFLSQVKIIEDIKRDNPNKAKPKAKAQERAQAIEDAKLAAEEEKAKAEAAPKAEEAAAAEEAPVAEEAPKAEEAA